jgi:hypothetical protein
LNEEREYYHVTTSILMRKGKSEPYTGERKSKLISNTKLMREKARVSYNIDELQQR